MIKSEERWSDSWSIVWAQEDVFFMKDVTEYFFTVRYNPQERKKWSYKERKGRS